MALTKEARRSIQASIDALKKRLPLEGSDLDYESHLHTIRALQKVLDHGTQAKGAADKEKFQ